MGTAPRQDISQAPSVTLLEAMRLVADRDRVARQYATHFHDVLSVGVPLLAEFSDFPERWEQAVISLHLNLMSTCPDTLIARKCGIDAARTAAGLARRVLDSGWPDSASGDAPLKDLDDWLRAKGNQRNPGTTADIVTACLFAAFREGLADPPQLDQFLHH